MLKNYYDILEIPEDATEKEIKVAYRRLAIKYHPDKNPGNKEAEEKFREITEIYEILKDDKKRKKYDGEFVKHKRTKQGSNLKVSINVTRLELIQNIKKIIVIRRLGLCKKCDGTGSVNKILNKCIHCDGTGVQGLSLLLGVKKRCSYCKGIGKIPKGDKCSACNGRALVSEVIQHPLILNPFLEIVRIPKIGNCHPGGSSGDLIVNLIIAEDPKYKVNGLNVTRRINISPAQAVIGETINLKVFRKNIELKIPPGTQNGQEIILINKGITYRGEKGVFRAIIYIKIPLIITEKEKVLYHELQKLEKEATCQVKILRL